MVQNNTHRDGWPISIVGGDGWGSAMVDARQVAMAAVKNIDDVPIP